MKNRIERKSSARKIGPVVICLALFAAVSLALQVAYCAEPSVSTLKTRDDGMLRTLVVTDLHFYIHSGMSNPESVDTLKKLTKKFKPDLIVSTGDMWHENPAGQGYNFLKWACKQFAKLGTPWAFAWGNHDKADDYGKAHALLERAPNSLYRGAANDGNYRLEILNGKTGKPVWNFFMLNDSRGGMREEQLEWFKSEVKKIKSENPNPPPAFVFFHIPIREYGDFDAAESVAGVQYEGICHEDGVGNALETFMASGMVKATFCGHDHVNDYRLNIGGMKLVYARATGAGGYGGDKVKKGATLVTIDTTSGSYMLDTVFSDGSDWQPDDFQRNLDGGNN
ncbi:MAG: metallophosphoesterase [bacterium]